MVLKVEVIYNFQYLDTAIPKKKRKSFFEKIPFCR